MQTFKSLKIRRFIFIKFLVEIINWSHLWWF